MTPLGFKFELLFSFVFNMQLCIGVVYTCNKVVSIDLFLSHELLVGLVPARHGCVPHELAAIIAANM